jgi:hypothetical protein
MDENTSTQSGGACPGCSKLPSECACSSDGADSSSSDEKGDDESGSEATATPSA